MRIAILVFLPLLAAPAVYALGRRRDAWRDAAAIGICALSLAASLWNLLPIFTDFSGGPAPVLTIRGILITGLSFHTDAFRAVYSLIASLMWLCTTLFGREYFRHEPEGLDAYWMFTLMTLGATQGVMLSSDLMTTFVFFEILSLTSFTWVVHEQTRDALYAGYTYLFVAVIGGLVLLMGLILLSWQCGTLEYSALASIRAGSAGGAGVGMGLEADPGILLAAGICILLGFGAKAGMFPLHVWLPMAHPVAPSPASALLSGILTKVGVFGILMGALPPLADNAVFGLLALSLGLITMALGAVLALFSVNLKRTLACSSMSQIGFILTGIASAVLCGTGTADASVFSAAAPVLPDGTALALSGAVLHMANHSLLKLLLFMCAGVVVMNLHALTLDEIRGWGRGKTALKTAFAVGALGISGVPLFNGYLSKSMLHEGLARLIEIAEESALADMGAGGLPESALAAPHPFLELGINLLPFLRAAEWVFLISGGCTFAYMLKLYFCVFVEKNRDKKRQKQYDKNPRCMDRLSTGVICFSASLAVLMGQPRIALPLARQMAASGARAPLNLHFAAFAWENLRGSLISLSIGAAIYLLFVLPVLRPNGAYANRWPAALDLERRGYRPVLTRELPRIFGALARIAAENVFLRPLCRGAVFAGGALARAAAENRLSRPLCRGLMFAAAAAGRALSDSTDALIVLSRRTLVREVRVKDGREPVGRWRTFRRATEEALGPVTENFSFAMLMTCVGILLILGLLLFLL